LNNSLRILGTYNRLVAGSVTLESVGKAQGRLREGPRFFAESTLSDGQMLREVYPEHGIEILHGVYPEVQERCFTEFILSMELRSFTSFRMTSEGFSMTAEGLSMTEAKCSE